MKEQLFPTLSHTIAGLKPQEITEERKSSLNILAAYIQSKVDAKQEINLNFICTHNSRRSHLAQVWAQTMAAAYDINGVNCYSAGTEATAIFPKIVETLQGAGFEISVLSEGNNPVHAIKFGKNNLPVLAFSKELDHAFNPVDQFAAIMTCSQADEGCPFIAGAEKRIPITYEDPKAFDNSPKQNEMYNQRSNQIATEMAYVFAQIKSEQ